MEGHDIVLDCQNVHRHFGSRRKPVRVLADINLQIARGQSVALLGKSGSGKSTLFNMIVGTFRPTQGRVLVATGEGMHEVTGHGRDRGIVYQQVALLPHMTAVENVAIGLVLNESTIPRRTYARLTGNWNGRKRGYIERAEQLLVQLDLSKALHRYPTQLSGGEQQRVAVARGLIMEPEILLLDEPFGKLDPQTRHGARKLLLSIHEENMRAVQHGEKPKTTVIIVTHSHEEAVIVSDRVIAISQDWKWEERGHTQFPGSTIVYDKAAPVFGVRDKMEAGDVLHQAEEINRVLYESGRVRPEDNCTFWAQVQAGEVQGVLA